MRSWRWINEKDVKGGRLIVKGWWKSEINGEKEECKRKDGKKKKDERLEEKIEKIIERMDKIEGREEMREREWGWERKKLV